MGNTKTIQAVLTQASRVIEQLHRMEKVTCIFWAKRHLEALTALRHVLHYLQLREENPKEETKLILAIKLLDDTWESMLKMSLAMADKTHKEEWTRLLHYKHKLDKMKRTL